MKVFFYTLGCKVNQSDTQALRAALLIAGHTDALAIESADVILLNSCAVTAESERKVRQKLRGFRVLNRDAILVLTGCAVQTNPRAAYDYPDADLLLGHHDAQALPAHLDAFLRCGQRIVSVSSHHLGESFDTEAITVAGLQRTRATVKIEDGCDRFCAYCIIPHARGPVRSKPLPALQKELQGIAAQGFAEVVLVGINLSAYGRDLGCELCDAVRLADATPGIARVRLGSLEPNYLSAKTLETLLCFKSLCNHFHISLQSGCDKTLRAMRRHYTAKEFFDLMREIKLRFPDAALTTDVIVGFPGESDADFAETLTFVRESEFAKVHVFPYSPRKGTPAADFPHQCSKSKKQQRAHALLDVAAELRGAFLASQVGKRTAVLLEQPHPLGGWQGYTSNYTPVRVLTNAAAAADDVPPKNRIAQVEIISVEDDSCTAKLLE
ncbi:MAG: tRNA (N(6)-L-threonylcarbamoyladenosine(37)-C(2))-methylthiotransferase MtaB [Oscillospiraceae bacterium]|nr:tRNA (N(6)-L-threonylcarbamoyladenosine(37)-C(2))-methylthiotransferase MtaB [Oscillospiraceae bacterium]